MTNLGEATLMLMPRSANDCNTSVYLRVSARERVAQDERDAVWRVMKDELGSVGSTWLEKSNTRNTKHDIFVAGIHTRTHSKALRLLLRLRARPAP
jgi:hypothetical protein